MNGFFIFSLTYFVKKIFLSPVFQLLPINNFLSKYLMESFGRQRYLLQVVTKNVLTSINILNLTSPLGIALSLFQSPFQHKCLKIHPEVEKTKTISKSISSLFNVVFFFVGLPVH